MVVIYDTLLSSDFGLAKMLEINSYRSGRLFPTSCRLLWTKQQILRESK